MRISIATVFPDLYAPFLKTSLIGKSVESGILDISTYGFTSFVKPKEHIDVPTCGPTPGMLIKPEVVDRVIQQAEAKAGKAFKIFFSPHGDMLDQKKLLLIKRKLDDRVLSHILLIAGRYEGMDARVEEHYADEVISVGDFVLLGGDLPAMMFIEGFVRHIPKVVGNRGSVENDSFTGPLVDYPEYCLPVVWHDKNVPDIIRSGNHNAIAEWRTQKAVERTALLKFCWARSFHLENAQKKQFLVTIPGHYVVLMHSEVLVGKERVVGNTSVTSIDVHDIARSACTYGFKRFFIVTALKDQQAIVAKFLEFWQEGDGITYNQTRHEALARVQVVPDLSCVLAAIAEIEGRAPVVIATSARFSGKEQERLITYDQQADVWKKKQPVLMLLGTGQGLAQECIDKADYCLEPLQGLTEYNHLSVRSAAAIIFDRWLGLNVQQKNKK